MLELCDRAIANQDAQLCAPELIAGAELMDVCMRVNAGFEGCDMNVGVTDSQICADITLAEADVTTGQDFDVQAVATDQTLGALSAAEWQSAGVQFAVSKCLRDQVLQCLHGTAWAAVRKRVWWPSGKLTQPTGCNTAGLARHASVVAA